MTNPPDTSFPAVAAGASAEERVETTEARYVFHRGQWHRENRPLGSPEGGHLSPVTNYGGFELAAALDEIALLRATPAAPVGAPSELSEELRELECIAAEVEAHDYATAPQRLRDISAAISRIVSASLPPVEGAGQDLRLREMSPAQRRAFAAQLERDVPTAGDYARAMRRASLPPAGDVFVGTARHPASCPNERCRLDGECNDDRACPTKAPSLPPVERAGVEEAQGPVEDCSECEGTGTAVLTVDVAGQAASLKRCGHCKGTGKVRETIRWRNLPPVAVVASDVVTSALAILQSRHRRQRWVDDPRYHNADPSWSMQGCSCGEAWPCPVATLLTEVTRLQQEREGLEAERDNLPLGEGA